MKKKLEGNQAPSHAHFPPVTGSKFWDSHFVQHSLKSNNYIFEDDLIPHSPQGKDSNLWSLSIVYIYY